MPPIPPGGLAQSLAAQVDPSQTGGNTLPITGDQRRALRTLINRPSSPYRDNRRAWIILNRADGFSQAETAQKLGVSRPVVIHWEQRFRTSGLAGLAEAKGRGRKERIDPAVRERIIVGATQPPAHRRRWSVRTMAKAAGVSKATVQRLWSANAIKPHVTRTFKLSTDKHFEKKFWDVIGLYLHPPDRALVLCCDEKSQCQALERTQPGFPVLRGYTRTRTHDYKRHGTVTLFAALSYLDGKIFSQTAATHTHRQWLAFLKQLDREAPHEVTLHLIADNYATHNHAKVKSWIRWRNQQHQKACGLDRVVMHFTPTSSSWMNMVERFFRDLTEDVVRDGSFTSVGELVQAIMGYLDDRNLNPKPYVWKKTGEEILAKLQRARQALAPIQ
jgi:transposase/DNA-binding XRE family transcriptional regulator